MLIKIIQDGDSESPREWDNLGTMVCWHNRYNLGDERPGGDPQEWYEENIPKGSEVLSLYLYDHSGIMMSTSNSSWPFTCMWDSGQVGWIIVTPDEIRTEYGVQRISKKLRGRVRDVLRSEVKTYSLYLQGECWGYSVEDGDEHIDSCWGFIGDDLESTGILDQLPESVTKDMVEAAWEARS